MQEKHIKRLVVKQLKKEFPDWRRLPKKEKKRLAKQVLDEVMRDNASNKMESVPARELTNTPIPGSDIIALSDMERFIEETTKCVSSGVKMSQNQRFQNACKGAAGSKRIIETGGRGAEWNQDSTSPFIR
jgi:hypothetical protein